MKQYDYLIVGAGLFGSICAKELTDAGYKCLVIDKRNHIGGNCFTEKIDGINVHKYGPHIFHTSNKMAWDYVNNFSEFNHFVYRPKVNYKENIYSFPINLMTLYQIYGVRNPIDAKIKLESVRHKIDNPKNFEEWILSQVGTELYETFIKGYTTKQWGRDSKNLPISIIKRIPIRFTYDDNYYNDSYQGIPKGGYTQIFEKLLENIEVRLNVDFFDNKDFFYSIAKKIIYTGSIDKFYDYKFGKLEYRSIKFEHEKLNIEDYQGNAAINYTDINIPYTRIIEHKHFEFGNQPTTIITKEYSQEWNSENEAFYPINDEKNNNRYDEYKKLSSEDKNIIFGGRLAEYKYYDMHQIIASALIRIKKEIEFKGNI